MARRLQGGPFVPPVSVRKRRGEQHSRCRSQQGANRGRTRTRRVAHQGPQREALPGRQLGGGEARQVGGQVGVERQCAAPVQREDHQRGERLADAAARGVVCGACMRASLVHDCLACRRRPRASRRPHPDPPRTAHLRRGSGASALAPGVPPCTRSPPRRVPANRHPPCSARAPGSAAARAEAAGPSSIVAAKGVGWKKGFAGDRSARSAAPAQPRACRRRRVRGRGAALTVRVAAAPVRERLCRLPCRVALARRPQQLPHGPLYPVPGPLLWLQHHPRGRLAAGIRLNADEETWKRAVCASCRSAHAGGEREVRVRSRRAASGMGPGSGAAVAHSAHSPGKPNDTIELRSIASAASRNGAEAPSSGSRTRWNIMN